VVVVMALKVVLTVPITVTAPMITTEMSADEPRLRGVDFDRTRMDGRASVQHLS
jgi:hypothetical protein